MRELDLWYQALQRRRRGTLRQRLFLTNPVRQWLGAEPIDLDGRRPASRADGEAFEALVGRNSEWWEN